MAEQQLYRLGRYGPTVIIKDAVALDGRRLCEVIDGGTAQLAGWHCGGYRYLTPGQVCYLRENELEPVEGGAA